MLFTAVWEKSLSAAPIACLRAAFKVLKRPTSGFSVSYAESQSLKISHQHSDSIWKIKKCARLTLHDCRDPSHPDSLALDLWKKLESIDIVKGMATLAIVHDRYSIMNEREGHHVVDKLVSSSLSTPEDKKHVEYRPRHPW